MVEVSADSRAWAREQVKALRTQIWIENEARESKREQKRKCKMSTRQIHMYAIVIIIIAYPVVLL